LPELITDRKANTLKLLHSLTSKVDPHNMKDIHFVQSTEPLEGGSLGRATRELSEALGIVGAESKLVTNMGAGAGAI
jgi:hypothetical protein